jgi:hypothetical protein
VTILCLMQDIRYGWGVSVQMGFDLCRTEPITQSSFITLILNKSS